MIHVVALGRLRRYLAFPRVPGAIAELDGVRAIAILLVLGRHATRPFDRPDQAFLQLGGWQAGSVLFNGWTGVDLFFVLSGFLITHHVLRRFAGGLGGGQLRRYLVKRLLRIVPAYYACLLVVVSGALWFYPVKGEDLAWRTLYHLLFLQDYLGSDVVAAFWSLGVEEKFYLLAPLLLLPLAALRSKARYSALAVLFWLPALFRYLTLRAQGGGFDYVSYFLELRSPFHVSFDGLVLGCAAAFLYRSDVARDWLRARRRGVRLLAIGCGVSAALLCVAPLVESVTAVDGSLVGSAVSLSFAVAVVGLLGSETVVNRWLSARWMLFFSKISYSLYLVHMLFMDAVYRWIDSRPALAALSLEAQFSIYLPIFLTLSILAALLLHYAVEKPFLVLKDRL